MKILKHPLFWIVFGTLIFPAFTACTAYLIKFAIAHMGFPTTPMFNGWPITQLFTSYAWMGKCILLRLPLTVVSAFCAWLWGHKHFPSARLLAGIGGVGQIVFLVWLVGPIPPNQHVIINYGVVEVLLWPICLVAFGLLARQPAK